MKLDATPTGETWVPHLVWTTPPPLWRSLDDRQLSAQEAEGDDGPCFRCDLLLPNGRVCGEVF